MADYNTDGRYGLRGILGSSTVEEVDEGVRALRDDVDANMAGYTEGTVLPAPGIAGQFFRNTDNGRLFIDTATEWIELTLGGAAAGFGPGDMKISAASAVPTGWLPCDGAAVSRTTYADLFEAIGTKHGAGDGSTTFNVPDMRGRVAVGIDSGAVRLKSSNTLGAVGGESRHLLVVSEMPAHNHSGTTGAAGAHTHTEASAGNHNHTGHTSTEDNSLAHGHALTITNADVAPAAHVIAYAGGVVATKTFISGTSSDPVVPQSTAAGWGGTSGTHTHPNSVAVPTSPPAHTHTISSDGGHTHAIDAVANHAHSISSQGGDGDHNNMQPYAIHNYIIKT